MPESITISDVMEFLVLHMTSNLKPAVLAEIFDRLIWCLADNGKELLDVRDNWLEGDDFQKVTIAIAMKETFPFNNDSSLRKGLARIAKRWPQLEERCNEILLEWSQAARG